MVTVRGVFLVSLMLASMLSGCLGSSETGAVIQADGESLDWAVDAASNGTVMNASASWQAGSVGCVPVGLDETEEMDHARVAIPQAARGMHFVVTFAAATPAEQARVSFFAGDVYRASFRTQGDQVVGTVPEGATLAMFSSCGGTDLTATLQVVAEPPVVDGVAALQHASTNWRVGAPGCVGTYYSGTDGYDHGRFWLTDTSVGRPFVARFSADVPPTEYGLDFFADVHLETFTSTDGVVEGRVPEGAAEVVVWTCGGGRASVDFTVVASG